MRTFMRGGSVRGPAVCLTEDFVIGGVPLKDVECLDNLRGVPGSPVWRGKDILQARLDLLARRLLENGVPARERRWGVVDCHRLSNA